MPDGRRQGRLCAPSCNGLEPLSLGEWEELHTRTLDLNPPAAPYVGYQIWGESYQRGAFLAKMNRALARGRGGPGRRAARSPGARSCATWRVPTEPLPELVEVLGPALERMLAALRKAEPDNPYVEPAAKRVQAAVLKT